MVGVKVPGLDLDRFLELYFGQIVLPQTHEIRCQVGSGGRRIGFQTDSLLKVRIGLGILRLRGIDQSQQFVNLEGLGSLSNDAFEADRSLVVLPRVILSDGSLELAV